MRTEAPQLRLDAGQLRPGLRLAAGVSGGADSVALLRALHRRSREMGLVLHAAHLHHGLRGAEADADLEFSRRLAAQLEVPFHEARVDTAAEAKADPATGKPGETTEEAARRLRYAWFRRLMSEVPLDAAVTAHTLDDQAETVLGKFLRGAWTEGLAGISPVLEFPEGRILRPLLAVTRAEIEAYLNTLGQPWREDSSNRQLSFTRNRIRHELLPLLESWNPKLREHLAHLAELARDEESWWRAEVGRLAPQLLLPGKPVRGGGRAAGTASLAIDVSRFAGLAPAVQRRLLRRAAAQFGAAPDFAATEALRTMACSGRAGEKCELEGLYAERSPRELRLQPGPAARSAEAAPAYTMAVPGEIEAPAFGLRLRIETFEGSDESNRQKSEAMGKLEDRTLVAGGRRHGAGADGAQTATLRNWRSGDRARLRHSGSPRKVKEILERLRVTGSERALWPVLELEGRIVWMKGADLEPEPGVRVHAELLEEQAANDSVNGTSGDG